MKLGNTVLVAHGIQTERSDIRAHVSVAGQCVYVFDTAEAVTLIRYAAGVYKRKPTFSVIGGVRVQTADGWLIPPEDLSSCRCVPVPEALFAEAQFDLRDSTSVKGKKAVKVVAALLARGLLPIQVRVQHIDDVAMQIRGTDLAVQARQVNIQVKCDWRAGVNGTGYLYLQTAECNPLQAY